MKNLIILFILGTTIPCLSQQITNTDFYQSGKQIIITYDLIQAKANQTFDISLYVSTDNGSTWQGPLEQVSGDVGKNLIVGKNSSITWNVLREFAMLKGKVGFRVVAKVNTKVEDSNLPNMVFVKGGTFQMGSNESDDEKPIHSVTVSDFYIGKYEVTVAEFEKFITATRYKTDAEKGGNSRVYTTKWETKEGVYWKHDIKGDLRLRSDYNHPVIHVSWNDATAYCKWLKETTGKGFRLPTEAEWEYAAGGGNQSKGYTYSGSNTINNVAWNYENSRKLGSEHKNYGTNPVGQKLSNELGIYDMSGNVYEWCEDTWHSNYQNAPINGSAWIDEKSNIRLVRGGSWSINPNLCRVADRLSYNPYYRFNYIGFRVVRH
jgi:formylglycine-generating enzyme required for sulfatase activity